MERAGPAERSPRLAFLYVGGEHHMLHTAPVAAELARIRSVEVTCFVASDAEGAALKELLARLGAPGIPVVTMRLPRWIEAIGRLRPGWRSMKVPRLIAACASLRRFDAIVAADRTATILQSLPPTRPMMIHIPHGAGDRAKGYEPRIRLFDHVIVAGPKDRRRMVELGLVAAERCDVSGYIKLAGVNRLGRGREPKLFANDRTTILYNPHFDRSLSSWDRFAEPLIEALGADPRFNLIVAPHVRLFAGRGVDERARWERLAVPDKVIVDPGSPRSSDMSYTRAADIYLGDVSSQVYEFLARPRPCVFIDAHGAEWRDDPAYAMWRFGAVAGSIEAVLTELGRARQRHVEFVEAQRAAIADSFGDSGDKAPEIAARQILAAIQRGQ